MGPLVQALTSTQVPLLSGVLGRPGLAHRLGAGCLRCCSVLGLPGQAVLRGCLHDRVASLP